MLAWLQFRDNRTKDFEQNRKKIIQIDRRVTFLILVYFQSNRRFTFQNFILDFSSQKNLMA